MRTLLVFFLLTSAVQAQITVDQAKRDPRSIWYSHATLPPVYERSGTLHHVGHNPTNDKSGSANNEHPWLHTGGFDLVDPAKVTVKRMLWLPPKTKIRLRKMSGTTIQGPYTRIAGTFPEGTLVAEFILDGTSLAMARSRQKVKGQWVTDEIVHKDYPARYQVIDSCVECHEDIGQHSVDIDNSRTWAGTIRGLERGGPIHWHPFSWPSSRTESIPLAIRPAVKDLIEWEDVQ